MLSKIKSYFKFKKLEADYKASGEPGWDVDPDQLPEYFRPKYYSRMIRDAVRGASRLLEIEKPRIVYVPYMSDYKVFMVSDKLQHGIPAENYVGGVYDEGRNVIYIAIYDIDHELKTGEQKEASERELLHFALHELRHAYQKKHEEEEYYSGDNAAGFFAHIDDASEVDADAFSMAYTLNNIDSDSEHLSKTVFFLSNVDRGNRAKRAAEICRRHDWTIFLVTGDYIPHEVKKKLTPGQLRKMGLFDESEKMVSKSRIII